MRDALGEDIEPRLRGMLQGHAEAAAVSSLPAVNGLPNGAAPAERPRRKPKGDDAV
jgi:hypothetical protein